MASSSSKFDPLPPDKSDLNVAGMSHASAPQMDKESDESGEENDEIDEQVQPLSPQEMLLLLASAENISRDYQQRTIEKPLAQSYRAWRNQHAEGSKYLGTAWRGRSRLFVPKTRSAIRKNLATAAASLFATDGVVNLSAQFEDDPVQRATAASIGADLDYRMTRTGSKSGLPWFQIAMGGCLDGQITGTTISKQYWEYEEVRKKEVKEVEVPVPLIDEETGQVIIDPLTGAPVLDVGVEMQEVETVRITKDRPMVDLYPIDNARFDPAAPWHSPVQMGRWFFMLHPMGLDDAKAMMASAEKGGRDSGWLEVDDSVLLKGRMPYDNAGVRRQREGGPDRYEEGKSAGKLDIVWLQENFMRIAGVDWHFWSVSRHQIISKIRRTEDVYPEFAGERPYVMGVSSIDTHQIFPMSPTESWQPLQIELNDITNLRQDTLKRSIAPIAKVRRGRNVDLTQVQRRGQPDAVLLVDNQDDVEFQATPGPAGSAYTETSVNNAMFDELAGVFSTSSVQQSRQLNETVGGMRLMSGAANAVSEFDLRLWIETWVEPVIRQLAHLVKYYETDERMLMLSNAAAQTQRKFQHQPTLDDFEQVELFVRVNAGIGALDPMQKLSKLKVAFEMLAPIMPLMQEQGIKLKAEALVEEVMGAAGFRDGMRFFEMSEGPAEPKQDPELQKFLEEMKVEREKMAQDFKMTVLELQAENQRNLLDNRTKVQIEQLRGKRELGRDLLGIHADRESRSEARQETQRDRMFGVMKDAVHTNRAKLQAQAKQAPQNEPQEDDNDLLARLEEVEAREEQIIEALKAIQQQLVRGVSQPTMQ